MASRRRGSLELDGALEGAGEHPARIRRAPRARSAPADWRLAVLTLLFAAFGAGLILILDDATARSRVYTSTPEFKVWATLTICLIAALPTVWRVGIDLLRLLLRECLLSALTTVGLLVSAGVLLTGAQRQAALADAKFTAPYPSAYVLIWGLAFSGLLVVNFLPAFRRLSRLANATIDAMLPVLPPGADGWQDRLQERNDLAGLLQVTGGVKDVLTSAVLVAGPLISSAFSMFLPGPPS